MRTKPGPLCHLNTDKKARPGGCPGASATTSNHAHFVSVCCGRVTGARLKALCAGLILPGSTTNNLGRGGAPSLECAPPSCPLEGGQLSSKALSFLWYKEMVSECSRKPSPMDYSWHGG